jgi:glycolate oxidase iron-sulfur subunit
LTESTWCCGSAGIYNITQPEMAAELQERKLRHVAETGASIVATANPGCILQLESGVRKFSTRVAVRHPISLLAEAYRSEDKETVEKPNGSRTSSRRFSSLWM